MATTPANWDMSGTLSPRLPHVPANIWASRVPSGEPMSKARVVKCCFQCFDEIDCLSLRLRAAIGDFKHHVFSGAFSNSSLYAGVMLLADVRQGQAVARSAPCTVNFTECRKTIGPLVITRRFALREFFYQLRFIAEHPNFRIHHKRVLELEAQFIVASNQEQRFGQRTPPLLKLLFCWGPWNPNFQFQTYTETRGLEFKPAGEFAPIIGVQGVPRDVLLTAFNQHVAIFL